MAATAVVSSNQALRRPDRSAGSLRSIALIASFMAPRPEVLDPPHPNNAIPCGTGDAPCRFDASSLDP